jgi:hypothetical protein
MFTMIKDEVKQDWQLSPKDRCDKCNAEALVQVTGIPGDLLFCGHHYNSIMSTPKGYKSMMSKAFTSLHTGQNPELSAYKINNSAR